MVTRVTMEFNEYALQVLTSSEALQTDHMTNSDTLGQCRPSIGGLVCHFQIHSRKHFRKIVRRNMH